MSCAAQPTAHMASNPNRLLPVLDRQGAKKVPNPYFHMEKEKRFQGEKEILGGRKRFKTTMRNGVRVQSERVLLFLAKNSHLDRSQERVMQAVIAYCCEGSDLEIQKQVFLRVTQDQEKKCLLSKETHKNR